MKQETHPVALRLYDLCRCGHARHQHHLNDGECLALTVVAAAVLDVESLDCACTAFLLALGCRCTRTPADPQGARNRR